MTEKEIKNIDSKTVHACKVYAKKVAIITSTRWKHRRRMAYISLFSTLAVTYICLYDIDESKLRSLDTIITWFYVTMGSVIGAYLGFSTMDDKWTSEKKKKEEEE